MSFEVEPCEKMFDKCGYASYTMTSHLNKINGEKLYLNLKLIAFSENVSS